MDDNERDNVIRLVANLHEQQPADPNDTSELEALIEDAIQHIKEEGYTTGIFILVKDRDFLVMKGHSISVEKFLSLLQRVVTEEIVLTSNSLR